MVAEVDGPIGSPDQPSAIEPSPDVASSQAASASAGPKSQARRIATFRRTQRASRVIVLRIGSMFCSETGGANRQSRTPR